MASDVVAFQENLSAYRSSHGIRTRGRPINHDFCRTILTALDHKEADRCPFDLGELILL